MLTGAPVMTIQNTSQGSVAAASAATSAAAAVLVAGIAGEIAHTGLFFAPALATVAVPGIQLWRERS